MDVDEGKIVTKLYFGLMNRKELCLTDELRQLGTQIHAITASWYMSVVGGTVRLE